MCFHIFQYLICMGMILNEAEIKTLSDRPNKIKRFKNVRPTFTDDSSRFCISRSNLDVILDVWEVYISQYPLDHIWWQVIFNFYNLLLCCEKLWFLLFCYHHDNHLHPLQSLYFILFIRFIAIY